MTLEHEKSYRFLTNYLEGQVKDTEGLREALRLIVQSDKEIVKIKAIRDGELKVADDAQRETRKALQELGKAREDNSIAIINMQNDYTNQEANAKRLIAPTLAELDKVERALESKKFFLDELIATKTALAAELDVKADDAEKRSAAAIARIKKAKDEIALVEE